jgi:HlyD family secretion protein
MGEDTGSRKRGIFGWLVAIILILAFGGFSVSNYVRSRTIERPQVIREEKIPVEVKPSRVMDISWILELTGDIRPMREVDVYPKVPGKIIQTLLVEKGDYVKKGDLIAKLEDHTINAQLAEARAALESARANLRQILANLELLEKDRIRLENLYKEKAVAKQRLDHIEAQYEATLQGKKAAQAQIKRAQAALRQLRILYRDHRIHAPISGYISRRYVDPGAMSATAQPIVRISNEGELKIITTVTEKDFPHIRRGMKAEIRVDAFPDKVFTGAVSIISPTIDPATRTGEIEIHIPNKDLTLCSGMFAHIRLELGERNALVIPKDALNRLPGTGNYYAYVVEGGKAVMKNIKIGVIQGNYAEVTEGMEEGEQVVVKGQNRLKDGTRVTVKAHGTGGKANATS